MVATQSLEFVDSEVKPDVDAIDPDVMTISMARIERDRRGEPTALNVGVDNWSDQEVKPTTEFNTQIKTIATMIEVLERQYNITDLEIIGMVEKAVHEDTFELKGDEQ